MFTYLLIVVLAGFCDGKRIIEMVPAKDKQFRPVAAVIVKDPAASDVFVNTGTFIGKRWVLTTKMALMHYGKIPDARHVTIFYGITYFQKHRSGGTKYTHCNVSKIIFNEYSDDIDVAALINTETALDPEFGSVCKVVDDSPFGEIKYGVVVGFGDDLDDEYYKMTYTHIICNYHCHLIPCKAVQHNFNSSKYVCPRGVGEFHGSFVGDMGSPLLIGVNEKDLALCGVFIFAKIAEYTRHFNHKIYSRTSEWLDFMERHVPDVHIVDVHDYL